MADTSGTITITGITLTRAITVSSFDLETLAHFLSTVIYDFQDSSYDGSNYTVTDGNDLRVIDQDTNSRDEACRFIATLVTDNPGTSFDESGSTLNNSAPAYTIDLTQFSLDDVVALMAGFMIVVEEFASVPVLIHHFQMAGAL